MFWVKGILNISGGTFSQNEAPKGNGGVVYASEDSSVTISEGYFEGNEAVDGGAVYIAEDAELFVGGGFYSKNWARNGGGAFWAEDGGDLEVSESSSNIIIISSIVLSTEINFAFFIFQCCFPSLHCQYNFLFHMFRSSIS